MSNLSETSKSEARQPSLSVTPQIYTVLFDYGQVLSRGPNLTAWERLREFAGGTPEIFHDAYWGTRHDYDRGTLSGTQYWNGVARTAGHAGLSEAELEHLYRTDVDLWTDLNEPMVLWAKELQQRGIRTGILSNIGDRMEIGIRRKFAWLDEFHHCTWSHRLKLAKPEIEIYQHAARELETEANHILFIDDREENVMAARAAGMVALRYSTHEVFLADMRQHGLGSLL